MSGPLEGLRLWLTRPSPKDDFSAREWERHGAAVVVAATATIIPARLDASDRARIAEAQGAWVVLVSPRAAENFVASAGAEQSGGGPWVAVAVGAATAQRARELGFDLEFTSPRATGRDLAEALRGVGLTQTVLLPSSDLRRDELADALRDRGHEIVELQVHETRPVTQLSTELLARLGSGSLDAIAAYSPSALAFVEALEGADRTRVLDLVALCLGETTAARARQLGFDQVVVPADPSEANLIDAAASWWARP